MVQVNGKVRDKIEVPAGIGAEAARASWRLHRPAVQSWLEGAKFRKVIFAGGQLMQYRGRVIDGENRERRWRHHRRLPFVFRHWSFVGSSTITGGSVQQIISSPPARCSGPYATPVRAGDFVFCSGQTGLDPATGVLAGGRSRPGRAGVG